MGQDPESIRQQIEQTRSEMSETVEAIGYKTDVRARAKESITGKVDAVKEKIGGTTSRVSDAAPDAQDVRAGARRAAGLAQENPLGLALGALAAGFVAGLVVPSTRAEDKRLGPMADEVKERAKDVGHEALDQGRQVAQEVATSAIDAGREAAQERGAEAGQAVAQSVGGGQDGESQEHGASGKTPDNPQNQPPQAAPQQPAGATGPGRS
jgi:hypothetical protein